MTCLSQPLVNHSYSGKASFRLQTCFHFFSQPNKWPRWTPLIPELLEPAVLPSSMVSFLLCPCTFLCRQATGEHPQQRQLKSKVNHCGNHQSCFLSCSPGKTLPGSCPTSLGRWGEERPHSTWGKIQMPHLQINATAFSQLFSAAALYWISGPNIHLQIFDLG